MSSYTMSATLDADVDTTEKAIREALADQGFGILTEIDLQATLREKVGHEMAPYRILGACRPPLAKEAVSIDPDVGALLPCNVVVRALEDGRTHVAVIDPDAMLSVSPAGEQLRPVADDARERLQRALDEVSSSLAD